MRNVGGTSSERTRAGARFDVAAAVVTTAATAAAAAACRAMSTRRNARIGALLLVLLLAESGGLGPRAASAQRSSYAKELRYLEYYLGIAPANEDGAFLVDG